MKGRVGEQKSDCSFITVCSSHLLPEPRCPLALTSIISCLHKGNHCLVFQQYGFLLPVFVLYVNGISQAVLFCGWLLSFNIVGGSSILSHVIVSHSFSLLYDVL